MQYDIPRKELTANKDKTKTILGEAIDRVSWEEMDQNDGRSHRASSVRWACCNNHITSIAQLETSIRTGEFGKIAGMGERSIICAKRVIVVAKEIKRFQADIREILQLKDSS